MTYTGPWITPPPKNTWIVVSDVFFSESESGTVYNDVAEIPERPATNRGGEFSNMGWSRDAFGVYRIGQHYRYINISPENLAASWYPALPPNATGVEFEPDVLAEPYDYFASIDSLTVHMYVQDEDGPATADDVTVTAYARDPADLVYEDPPPVDVPEGYADPVWLPGADLADLTVAGSVYLDAAFTVNDGWVVFPGSLVHVPDDPDGFGQVNFILAFEEQVDHDVPAASSGRTVRPTFQDNLDLDNPTSMFVTWQPPRHRFIYAEAPPLRQRQRDDGVRQRAGRNRPSSVQASARQRGATYR